MNVVILTSGRGSRLGILTEGLNKALVPVNNKAVISYIIDKFPADTTFYITLGYLGSQVQDFLSVSYPDRTFRFVWVENWEGEGSGPGTSIESVKPFLQEDPFYFVTCDCIVEEEIPIGLQKNWIGVQETLTPEIYSTACCEGSKVLGFENKSKNGYDKAFIGLSYIYTPGIFWEELTSRKVNGELVEVFKAYDRLELEVVPFTWHDTGNLSSLQETVESLTTHKTTGENLYLQNGRAIKRFRSEERSEKFAHRLGLLGKYKPENIVSRGQFTRYDWIEGSNLYEANYQGMDQVYRFILDCRNRAVLGDFKKELQKHYLGKVQERVSRLNYGVPELQNLTLDRFLQKAIMVKGIHGDLQPANIIYTTGGEVKFIDCRVDFGGGEFGDLYYDLGKLYGGLLENYRCLFQNFKETEKDSIIRVGVLDNFTDWIEENGFDLNHVRLVTSLVWLSMSPLHPGKEKYLFRKGITLLRQVLGEKESNSCRS